MRGQLSAEMLILLMLIIGLVIIVYSSMNKNVANVASAVDKNTDTTIQIAKTRVSCDNDAFCRNLGFTQGCGSDKYCVENAP